MQPTILQANVRSLPDESGSVNLSSSACAMVCALAIASSARAKNRSSGVVPIRMAFGISAGFGAILPA